MLPISLILGAAKDGQAKTTAGNNAILQQQQDELAKMAQTRQSVLDNRVQLQAQNQLAQKNKPIDMNAIINGVFTTQQQPKNQMGGGIYGR